MFQLPCPECESVLVVSTARAGSTMTCDACQQEINIPKLRELKQLDIADTAPAQASPANTESAGGRSVAFAGIAFLATACLVAGAFSGVRYALLDAPMSTEKHIEEVERVYPTVTSAQLFREWEDLDEFGVDLIAPYQYQKAAEKKANWGRSTIAFLAGFVACFGGSLVLSRRGRPSAS
ncbi:MAG: hypothetical protein AAGD07_12365 [Planctomycetota bacterium]